MTAPSQRSVLWQSRTVAAAILAGAIFIAGTIAAIGFDDDETDSAAPRRTTTVPEQTTTTRTGGVVVPKPTTTLVPTTTIAPNVVPTTTAGGGPAPTNPPGGCGEGNVGVSPKSTAVGGDDGTFEIPKRAVVTNNLSKAIEVVQLVLRITFDDSSTVDISLSTPGTVAAGAKKTYDDGVYETQKQPVSIEVSGFAYQTAGRPDCKVEL